MRIVLSTRNVLWVTLLLLLLTATYRHRQEVWQLITTEKYLHEATGLPVLLFYVWMGIIGLIALVLFFCLFFISSGDIKFWKTRVITVKLPAPRKKNRISQRDEIIMQLGVAVDHDDDDEIQRLKRMLERYDREHPQRIEHVKVRQ
jgi:hypothetical protein